MTHSMLDVLQWRERRCRLALARLARTLGQKKRALQAIETLDTAVNRHIRASHDSRFTDGACTASKLAELEAHISNLRAQREQLATLQRQAALVLRQTAAQHETAAHQWQRSEQKSQHAQQLARRERALRANIRSELEEEHAR
jgi:hypothetical protein